MNQINSPVCVTGGAGFIGSYLVDQLLKNGIETHVVDNMSNGRKEHIERWQKMRGFKFHKIDLLDTNALNIFREFKRVYHFAANPEVRVGTAKPEIHFEQNILATFNLLEALRKSQVDTLVFASSSTVYGDAEQIPTSESYAPLKPISLYGASKLACEALISSYSHTFGFKSTIFRFANIIGENSTHGVIFDFLHKLRSNPSEIEVLGDGHQKKSYLYISDCIRAIQLGIENQNKKVEIFNVGSEDSIEVRNIATIVIEELGLRNVNIKFTGGIDGGRGWKGDVKKMLLDVNKIKSVGWRPKYNSFDAVIHTIRNILNNLQ